MFARLKSYFRRFICWALILAIFVTIGYAVGITDGFSAGRQMFVEQGIQAGIRVTLNDAANRGFGRWVAMPGIGSGEPQTRFLWLDDEFPPTAPRNPCIFKKEDGVKQIGQPDRGASLTRPRVTLCKVTKIKAADPTEAETTLEKMLSGQDDVAETDRLPGVVQLLPFKNPEKGITTIHSPDPCDPLNFVYFMLSLATIAGGSALAAMGVHRIHVYRKSRLVH